MASSAQTDSRSRTPRRFSLRNSLSSAPKLFITRSKSSSSISSSPEPQPESSSSSSSSSPSPSASSLPTPGNVQNPQEKAEEGKGKEEERKAEPEKEREREPAARPTRGRRLSNGGALRAKLRKDDHNRPKLPEPLPNGAGVSSETKDGSSSRKSMPGGVRPFTDDTTLAGGSSKPLERRSTIAVPQPRITISTFLKQSQKTGETSYGPTGFDTQSSSLKVTTKQSEESDEFMRPPRRSMTSPNVSRSPSPSSRDDRSSRDEDESTTASSVSSATSPTNTIDSAKSTGSITPTNDDQPQPTPLPRTSTCSARRSRRPMSMFIKPTAPDSTLPGLASKSVDAIPEIPAKHLANGNKSVPLKKVKDELYEAYKLLESDYQKFQNKSNLQKASILRQSVIPFFRRFREKASNNIAPEELEKRVRTLNRWWTGLLAQLRNRNAQAISGTDRPVYLEAISFIISRPEWRAAPSSFAPLAQRNASPAKSDSSVSLSSTASSYSIQKSVTHNIKVLFTRSLYDTLAFTIEKMALRTSPPVMVAFGGKVIAFAFFFCPGVAEMLISLWAVQPVTVRRVMPGFGVGRGTDLRGLSEMIVSEFPEALHSLGFSTLSSTMRKLKTPVEPPVGVLVDWRGPWISRWCGRDSDLLFVFFKYYHILMCEYLPPDASAAARICAPGYVMVLAQTLTLIDNIIHPQAAMHIGPDTTVSTTFDDLLNATATVPIPTRSLSREMADNKLVVLLRDVILDNICTKVCREIYLSSFIAMLKAAVQRTQLYNADACFQLMDLIEEILPILVQAEKREQGEYIDWKFWVGVMKMLLESENNMTELRVLSFIYSIWDILVEDEDRKREVCLDWLLDVPLWQRFFCHWCPMVRAYYMRLMCWRLGRFNGDATDVDVEIYTTLLHRLRTGYAHHLRLKEAADKGIGPRSSTAPCLPAPSRRLVILRNDITVSTGVILDGIVPTSVPFAGSASLLRSNSMSSLASLADSDGKSDTSTDSSRSNNSDASSSSTKSRWGALRSVLSFRSSPSPEDMASPPDTPPLTNNSSPSNDNPVSENPQPQKQANFKFSLEWIDRPMLGSRERVLGPPRLPGPTQKYLASRGNVVFNIFDFVFSEQDVRSKHWTYVGRAISEWLMVIIEYENFFDRRKMEGRETDKDVETPALGVDSMRRF